MRPPCVRVSGSPTQCVPARALAGGLAVVDPFDCRVMEPLCVCLVCVGTGVQVKQIIPL